MNNQKEQVKRINVEAFKQQLLNRKTTAERFRLPWQYEASVDAITAAYKANVEFRHRIYQDDIATQEHIKAAARWLTAECPKFGMLFCGQCGNGKTTLSHAIRDLVSWIYRHDYSNDGLYIKQVDAREICYAAKNDYKTYKGLCSQLMLSIDDLGVEPSEVLDYGNVLSPVIELLSRRYNAQLFTIVTTNLTPKQIREHYGERIADRFNEMFERIVFENSTYRTL